MLHDMCCCYSKRPSKVFYPQLQSPVAQLTFDMLVYEIGRTKQYEREIELAKVSGIGAFSKVMG